MLLVQELVTPYRLAHPGTGWPRVPIADNGHLDAFVQGPTHFGWLLLLGAGELLCVGAHAGQLAGRERVGLGREVFFAGSLPQQHQVDDSRHDGQESQHSDHRADDDARVRGTVVALVQPPLIRVIGQRRPCEAGSQCAGGAVGIDAYAVHCACLQLVYQERPVSFVNVVRQGRHCRFKLREPDPKVGEARVVGDGPPDADGRHGDIGHAQTEGRGEGGDGGWGFRGRVQLQAGGVGLGGDAGEISRPEAGHHEISFWRW